MKMVYGILKLLKVKNPINFNNIADDDLTTFHQITKAVFV